MAGHKVKLFSAIQVVNPTIRIPAFAGMTPEGLLKGFDQFGYRNILILKGKNDAAISHRHLSTTIA
jgi:hypothetical protein